MVWGGLPVSRFDKHIHLTIYGSTVVRGSSWQFVAVLISRNMSKYIGSLSEFEPHFPKISFTFGPATVSAKANHISEMILRG